jgi:ribosomal protein S18 acetylase RimI-like enzyme
MSTSGGPNFSGKDAESLRPGAAGSGSLDDLPVNIRSFQPSDLPACRKLYKEGLLGGKLAENDTGLDIDDIEMAYMKTPGNHFWVAETPASAGKKSELVGMIGVQHHDKDAAEIRRLRVAEVARRRGVGSRLFETAIKFCQEHNYLKVMLDTFVEREPAIRLFEKFHFKHSRTREVNGKELLYFYLDIYGAEERQKKKHDV